MAVNDVLLLFARYAPLDLDVLVPVASTIG